MAKVGRKFLPLGILTLLSSFTVYAFPDGTVRLVGTGATATQGRVEIHVGTQWGTICDDTWDALEAKVVCMQLGFNDVTQFVAKSIAFFGQGTVPILLDNLACSGNEKNLLKCTHPGVGVHNCLHSEDAGVICASAGDDGCLNNPPCKIPPSNCIYGVTEIVSVRGKRCPICRCASCPSVPRCPTSCESGKTEFYQGALCRRCRCVPQVLPATIEEPNSISVALMATVVAIIVCAPLLCLLGVLLYRRKQTKLMEKKKGKKADNSKPKDGVTVTDKQEDWFGGGAGNAQLVEIY